MKERKGRNGGRANLGRCGVVWRERRQKSREERKGRDGGRAILGPCGEEGRKG